MIYRSIGNIRAAETENPQIEADFVVFGDTFDMGWGLKERVDPHAFDGALTGNIRALLNHDPNIVLGCTEADTLSLIVTNYCLHGVISINPNDRAAMDSYERVKRGDISQCSFGFDVLEEDYEHQEDGTVICTIKRVKLYEVSVVTFPAYEKTKAMARDSHAFDIWKKRMKGRLENGTKAIIAG